MTRSRIVPALVAAFLLSGQMWAQQEVVSAGDKGVIPPRVVNLAKPTYTAAALERRIEGTVKMAAVVLSDGKVGDDVKILQSLDQELDELAVVALLQSEFKPGTKDGKPVAIRMVVETTFTLK